MAIQVLEERVFILNGKGFSYVIYLSEEGIPLNAYWGAGITHPEDFLDAAFIREAFHIPSPQLWPEEYAPFGGLRYKETAVKAVFSDGVRDLLLIFDRWELREDVLCIILRDESEPLEAALCYRVQEELGILERWCELQNTGDKSFTLEHCASAQFSLPGTGFQSINYTGRWSGEFQQKNTPVSCGKQVYESLCGLTGHQCAPFFAVHRGVNEEHGPVWFGVLSHSGNFEITVEDVCAQKVNIVAGISDTDFTWILGAGERFETPHVLAGYAEGLGAMSRMLHRFAREVQLPKPLAQKPLPVLYNSWYATEFSVTQEQQMALAERAAQLGVELFVMDDGWFSGRVDSTAGLGDWAADSEKFPQGLHPLIRRVKELGMDFGLWVEPEMVNPDSALYRAHPDWILRYPNRDPIQFRSQYMLDMGSPLVNEHLYHVLNELLCQYDITYLKWDMNRYVAEMGSTLCSEENGKSLWYRHTMGVYELAERLRRAHPALELEACASGGGRVDFGAMRYFDEFWPSDNTDPLDRLSIQRHYSLLYPVKCMRAWVTDDTNFNNRVVPLEFALHTAMCGALGIGTNLSKAAPVTLDLLRKNIAVYKDIREIVQLGDLYRLSSFENSPIQVVQYQLEGHSVLFAFLRGGQYGRRFYACFPRGLDPERLYRCRTGEVILQKRGDYLMYHGLTLELYGDWSSVIVQLDTIEVQEH